MQSQWAGQFYARVLDKREAMVKHLVGGGARNYDEYKYLVGYLQAIDDLSQIAHEVDIAMFGGPPSVEHQVAERDA